MKNEKLKIKNFKKVAQDMRLGFKPFILHAFRFFF